MSLSRPLDDLVGRARHRCLSNLVLKETAQALCVAMGGLIVLLVLGTEILDGRWLAALFVIGLLIGFRNLRAEMPSRYGIAQALDRNAALSDTLSTAFFYHRVRPDRKASDELRAAQWQQAERRAREVRVERAFPYRAPKSLYFMSVLGLIASSLIAVRYGISRRLDLRPPLSRIVFDVFHFADPPQKAARKNPPAKRNDDLLKQFGLSLDQQQKTLGPEENETSAADVAQSMDARKAPQEGQSRQQGISLDAKNQKPGDERGESALPQESDQNGSSQADANSDPAGNSSRQQSANSQNEDNSLLQKFRDAMANLMSRLKSQPRNGQSKEMASKANGRQDGAQQPSAGQKGSQQMAGRQNDPSQNGQPQGQQDGEGAQKAQAGSGKQSGNEAERASQEGRSGIGKEDGSKAIREAEQLAAMGKISEILGKRSQNLTGEMMVEVNAGKEQQLRTAYSQQSAAHGDAGGEIHRDEIPLAYQRYVQQYFDEIRKAAPPAQKPAQP